MTNGNPHRPKNSSKSSRKNNEAGLDPQAELAAMLQKDKNTLQSPDDNVSAVIDIDKKVAKRFKNLRFI